jgi:hypothetical protein
MIYKLDYAMELVRMGHSIFMTQDNPRYKDKIMWIFENDETFNEDFKRIRGKE